ncbi:hypothetical protein QW180_08465 [Vibrio sinaloensis]|nr:hypothetical protein [Vibrio sinaloensis]
MRSRLAFGCCVAIDFDVYLIDEATSVGDQKFRKKAKKSFIGKRVRWQASLWLAMI